MENYWKSVQPWKSFEKYAKVMKSMQTLWKVCKSYEKYAKVVKSMQKLWKVCESYEKYAKVMKSMQPGKSCKKVYNSRIVVITYLPLKTLWKTKQPW